MTTPLKPLSEVRDELAEEHRNKRITFRHPDLPFIKDACYFSHKAGFDAALAEVRKREVEPLRDALKEATKGLAIPAQFLTDLPHSPFIPGSAAEKLEQCSIEVLNGCRRHFNKARKALKETE